MGFFLRAVVSGFAFSMGRALFEKYKDELGLGETSKEPDSVDVSEAEEVQPAEEPGPSEDEDLATAPAT